MPDTGEYGECDDRRAESQADRDALRPLYEDEDFAAFDDFGGSIGYRIGIKDDGTWWFFVAGVQERIASE